MVPELSWVNQATGWSIAVLGVVFAISMVFFGWKVISLLGNHIMSKIGDVTSSVQNLNRAAEKQTSILEEIKEILRP